MHSITAILSIPLLAAAAFAAVIPADGVRLQHWTLNEREFTMRCPDEIASMCQSTHQCENVYKGPVLKPDLPHFWTIVDSSDCPTRCSCVHQTPSPSPTRKEGAEVAPVSGPRYRGKKAVKSIGKTGTGIRSTGRRFK